MGSFLLFGTLWFWLLIIAAIIAITISVEHDDDDASHSWWVWVIVVLILALYFGGNADSIKSMMYYVRDNPGTIVLWFFIYLICGTIWSFAKWFMFLKSRHQDIVNNDRTFRKKDFAVANHKERIMTWMIWWPMSGVWTIINDPVVKAFKYIFNSLSKQYQKIADSIMKDLKDDSKY